MKELFSNPAVLALLGAVFGGVGVKVVEVFFLRSIKKIDIAGQIREELRGDITYYRGEIRRLQDDLDLWKSRYYVLLEIIAKHDIDIPDELKDEAAAQVRDIDIEDNKK